MDQTATEILQDVLSRTIDHYEQLLLVDQEGQLVAAVTPPKHLRYREEVWWKSAYGQGKGMVYVGDIEWEEDRKRYALPVSVPIRSNGRVIGVLLAVHKIDRVFKSVTGVHLGKSDHTMLANSVGDLLFCPIFQIKNHTLNNELIRHIAKPEPGWTVSKVDVHYPGRDVINGFAPVRLNITGLSEESLGRQEWYIFTSQNPAETYAPLKTLFRWTGLSTIMGIVILVGLAIVVSRRIVTPIMKLEGATRGIISGIEKLPHPKSGTITPPSLATQEASLDEGPPLGIATGDEIEDLARSFSRISQVLDRTKQQLEVTTHRLEEMATTDELTGLYNRHYIWDELKAEFARTRRFNLDLSCLMIDLDLFKEVNDRYGHPSGDEVLMDLANLLRENSRELDTLARFGGEEFIVILPQTDSKGATTQAERLRREVENHSFKLTSNKSINLTISVGISYYPDLRIKSIEDIVKIADEALYTSKQKGRNNVSLG